MSARSKQSEKYVERKLVEAVEAAGGTSVKMALTGARGFPDRVNVYPGGRVQFVECKTTGQPLDPLQIWWQKLLTRLGAEWHKLDHTDDIPNIVNKRDVS